MWQWVEAVLATLKGQLGLGTHAGRTRTAGVFARTGQCLLALAAATWHHWTTDAPVKRSLIASE
ncbi:hypothetical protein GCM10022227_11050 [Streptomyces sedi]